MKKLLTILLTSLMIFTLVGCNPKPIEEQPVEVEPAQVIEPTESETILGGWTDVEDGTLTDELKDIFNKALDGLLGSTYEPVKLLAKQVVNGTNYKFLANGTKTTNPITVGTYNITINESSDGTISLVDIETIEESSATPIKDNTQLSFWVVFYDQYGNELQRTIEKYGTVPTFKGTLPSGFDKWVNKNTQKDVDTFKAITTNTYFEAVCHKIEDDSTPEPIPVPEYVQIECLISQPGAYINSKVTASNDMEFIFDAKMDKVEWCRCFGYWNASNSGLAFQSASGQYGGDLMFYASDGTKTYQYAESGVDIKEKTTYDVKYAGAETDASFIKVNGKTVKNFTTGSVDTNKEIAIFTLTSDGMASGDDKKPLSIYYMKIYKDGSLVRDYIPIKTLKEIDKSKNATDGTSDIPAKTLCFYDKVNDMYYLSFGANSFIEPTYQITLSAAGADNSGEIQKNVDVKFNEPMTEITGTLPLLSGHTFLGYYDGLGDSAKKYYNSDGTSAAVWDKTENAILYAKWDPAACLAKGTMITMADGSRKPIENLYEGDLIRVFDHNTGKVSSAKIMDYWKYEEKKSGLITLHFTNDIDVNIVYAHCFYNKEENRYILLKASNIDKYIGKNFYNVDNGSWETLLSATYSNEKVDTFFIATEGEFNAVAEGMLNVEDGLYYVLRNTYDFDEDMKVDEIKKANDIKRYGLFERSDFEYLTEDAFEKYGIANLKVALGKGVVTRDILDIIREECMTYESENIIEEYVPENIQHSVR